MKKKDLMAALDAARARDMTGGASDEAQALFDCHSIRPVEIKGQELYDLADEVEEVLG
jgi:hypothetical protein